MEKTDTVQAEGAEVRRPHKKRRKGIGGRPRLFAFLLILPTLLTVLGVVGYPWMESLRWSVHQENMFTKEFTFVGLDNYTKYLMPGSADSELFYDSFGRTLHFSILAVVGGNLLALGMALVLNQEFKGRGLMRSIVLLPWAMAPVLAGIIWAWIFNGEYGLLNAILVYVLHINDKYVAFLNDAFTALSLMGLIFIWNQAPLATLLILASLQAIPPNLYAAAKVDGANAVQAFWRITLPWLKSIGLLILILTSINAIMQFDIIFTVTSGGPGWATTVFSWLGYTKAFRDFRFGEGAAILYVLSLLCIILAIIYTRVLGQRIEV